MSQTPLMVSTGSPTVVTELPKVATTLLPGCERKSSWRCIGDTPCNTVTPVGDSVATHSQLIHNTGDHGNAWRFY